MQVRPSYIERNSLMGRDASTPRSVMVPGSRLYW